MARVPFMVPPSQSEQFIQPPFTSGFTIRLLGGSDSAHTHIYHCGQIGGVNATETC